MKSKHVLLALTTLLFVLVAGVLVLIVYSDEIVTSWMEASIVPQVHRRMVRVILQQVPMEESRRDRLLAMVGEHDAESAKEFWSTLDPEVRSAVFTMSIHTGGLQDLPLEEEEAQRIRENIVRRWMFRSALPGPEEDDAFLEELFTDEMSVDQVRELDRRLAAEVDEAGLPPAPWEEISDELERAVVMAKK